MPDAPRRRSRALVLALVALLALSNVAWLVGANVRSPREAAARAKPPRASIVTARVERRTLEATVLTRGDVEPRDAVVVTAPASVDGDPVVTASAEDGASLDEGARALEVSGRPVLVLQGAIPAFRTMRPGASGPDVVQLQDALVRLGFAPDRNGDFGASTEAAVAALYRSRGYEPMPASEDEEAELAAARRRVREADATVVDAEAALQRARRGPSERDRAEADAAVASAQRSLELARARRDAAVAQAEAEGDSTGASLARDEGDAAVADAEDAVRIAELARDEQLAPPDTEAADAAVGQARVERDAAGSDLARLDQVSGPTVPRGEVVFVPTLPAVVATAPVSTASGEEPEPVGGALLTLAAGGFQVVAELPSAEQDRLRPGVTAILLDEATGEEVDATVAAVATGPSEAGGAAVLRARLESDDLPQTWAGRNLRVTFTTAATEAPVLVVPLAAISSKADGTARVHRVSPEDDGAEEVQVVVGISADGFVEVRPTRGRLREGDLVAVGR